MNEPDRNQTMRTGPGANSGWGVCGAAPYNTVWITQYTLLGIYTPPWGVN